MINRLKSRLVGAIISLGVMARVGAEAGLPAVYDMAEYFCATLMRGAGSSLCTEEPSAPDDTLFAAQLDYMRLRSGGREHRSRVSSVRP